jgi:hypothetical protein
MQVVDFANVFGVAGCDHQSFFPARESHRGHILFANWPGTAD